MQEGIDLALFDLGSLIGLQVDPEIHCIMRIFRNWRTFPVELMSVQQLKKARGTLQFLWILIVVLIYIRVRVQPEPEGSETRSPVAELPTVTA